MLEKEIQNLIADFPWLLNTNYERVNELPKKGKEFIITGKNRIDLILKDKITNRPVFIEFKAVPFYRENIGQLLDYRAKCLLEISNEESLLYQVFGDQIVSPQLILVVPECSIESRIACNLSGIEIYEYEKSKLNITDPNIRTELDRINKELLKTELPLTTDRRNKVSKIYKQIEKILINNKYEYGIKNYKLPKGTYFYPLDSIFINLLLFEDYEISLGLYENIFEEPFNKISIDFYSKNKEQLEKFRKNLINKNFQIKIPEIESEDEVSEFYVTFYENKNDFVKNVNIIEKYIKEIIEYNNQLEQI